MHEKRGKSRKVRFFITLYCSKILAGGGGGGTRGINLELELAASLSRTSVYRLTRILAPFSGGVLPAANIL